MVIKIYTRYKNILQISSEIEGDGDTVLRSSGHVTVTQPTAHTAAASSLLHVALSDSLHCCSVTPTSGFAAAGKPESSSPDYSVRRFCSVVDTG